MLGTVGELTTVERDYIAAYNALVVSLLYVDGTMAVVNSDAGGRYGQQPAGLTQQLLLEPPL